MSDHIGETNGMIDHIVEPTKMVCPHCGLPADRNQNGIQGYRCGSSYCESFKPQWARSMTCLEIENKKLKGDLDLSYFGEDALIANVRNLRAHIKRLEEFVRSCANNFDCDNDAHKWSTQCRACDAQRLIDAKEAKP